MKVGILHAVPPDEDIGAVSDADKLRRFLMSADANITFKTYEATRGDLPTDPAECDAYAITGSPASTYHDKEWIRQTEAFIREAYAHGARLIGICFGHQLIAQALGGKVEPSAAGWLLGVEPFEVRAKRPWMQPMKPTGVYNLYWINHDIVTVLPEGAEIIGSHPACETAAFAIDDQVLCIQAHPEQPAEFLFQVVDYLAPVTTPQETHRARETLESLQSEGYLLSHWMINFLKFG